MTADRPYRKGMTPWHALEEIAGNFGKQFTMVAEAFHHILDKKLETMRRLFGGQKAEPAKRTRRQRSR